MKQFFNRAMTAMCIVALSACSGGSFGRVVPAQSLDARSAGDAASLEMQHAPGYLPFARPDAVKQMCPAPADGRMQCYALMRTDDSTLDTSAANSNLQPGTCVKVKRSQVCGYASADLAAAYDLPVTKGGGTTVATVDAYYYASAAADLAVYRAQFKLPPCTVGNGCLRIVYENGTTPPVSPSQDDWAPEQALDLDMISASCPKCHILLVETQSDYPYDLAVGVNDAVSAGAQIVSNSYGSHESGPATNSYYNHPGHVIVASAGDNGGSLHPYGQLEGGPTMPCIYSTVVCAGGTTLTGSGTKWRQTTWNTLNETCFGGINCGAGGSGCSRIVPKPAWQTVGACPMRSAADLSAVASVNTPVLIYSMDYQVKGWAGFGGTSASSPIIAGAIALAGNATKVSQPQGIWSHRGAHFTDITKGTNISANIGPCASPYPYICAAGPGYDGPTGWGSPDGVLGL